VQTEVYEKAPKLNINAGCEGLKRSMMKLWSLGVGTVVVYGQGGMLVVTACDQVREVVCRSSKVYSSEISLKVKSMLIT